MTLVSNGLSRHSMKWKQESLKVGLMGDGQGNSNLQATWLHILLRAALP
jgi:hypothetical protein